MPRKWDYYDTDEERLPEGMIRIGYDADDQVYTYRDADGSIWEGAPGCKYGGLTKISSPPRSRQSRDSETTSQAGKGQDNESSISGQDPPPEYSETKDIPITRRITMPPQQGDSNNKRGLTSWRTLLQSMFQYGSFSLLLSSCSQGVMLTLSRSRRQSRATLEGTTRVSLPSEVPPKISRRTTT